MAKLHLDSLKDVMLKVLLLRGNNLSAQETARQAFVMMGRIRRDVAGMMQACLALVAVVGFRNLLQRVDMNRRQ